MTITLPDGMRENLETRARAAGFENVDEFIEETLAFETPPPICEIPAFKNASDNSWMKDSRADHRPGDLRPAGFGIYTRRLASRHRFDQFREYVPR